MDNRTNVRRQEDRERIRLDYESPMPPELERRVDDRRKVRRANLKNAAYCEAKGRNNG